MEQENNKPESKMESKIEKEENTQKKGNYKSYDNSPFAPYERSQLYQEDFINDRVEQRIRMQEKAAEKFDQGITNKDKFITKKGKEQFYFYGDRVDYNIKKTKDKYDLIQKKNEGYKITKEQKTETWKEMLIQVCGHILLEKRSTIEWLCANEKCSFSATPEEWRRELAPGMYVWTDNSTATKINILHGMFEECNIPASELVFEFRSDQEGEDEE